MNKLPVIFGAIPNITGNWSTGSRQGWSGNYAVRRWSPDGSEDKRGMPGSSDTNKSHWGWDIDASRSSVIYGSSLTVQMDSKAAYVLIRI